MYAYNMETLLLSHRLASGLASLRLARVSVYCAATYIFQSQAPSGET